MTFLVKVLINSKNDKKLKKPFSYKKKIKEEKSVFKIDKKPLNIRKTKEKN